jgi:hypothetical protein
MQEQKNRSSFGRRRLQQTGQIKKTMHKSLWGMTALSLMCHL